MGYIRRGAPQEASDCPPSATVALLHLEPGEHDQHKFKLLWADGSASFIWECDLQDDSPAAYQRYMKEITAASNQQPAPEPEPEPDSETDSEPEHCI
eukprot:COSAG06_NODE_15184_length_1091_cov_2.355847_2_plen_97_part_00